MMPDRPPLSAEQEELLDTLLARFEAGEIAYPDLVRAAGVVLYPDDPAAGRHWGRWVLDSQPPDVAIELVSLG